MINSKNKSWQQEDVRALKKLFGSKSNSEIAMLLNRTPKAVERKAAKMKLFKTKKYLRALGRKV
ncbi:MAG: hypothetical protein WC523_00130 [Patescibacteria group bacterium]